MDFPGFGASSNWMAGCLECTARAVASHLQNREDWFAYPDVWGPWQHGHCHTPTGPGPAPMPVPHLSSTMSNNYGTPLMGPSLSPEESLISPLSSLGLDHDSLAEFASDFMPFSQKEESPTNQDEKAECPSTTRRIRRREQNRESQRRFRDRKESYTKHLERKISELEATSARLKSELEKLPGISVRSSNLGIRDRPTQCASCGSESRVYTDGCVQVDEGTVAG